MRRDAVRAHLLALIAALVWGTLVGAQAQPPPPVPTQVLSAFRTAEPAAESATLTFFNRDIVVLRARVLGRSPRERASGAARFLHELAAQRITGPVGKEAFDGGTIITVAS